jgi:lipopolysaccharide/colanic/teichoic acid biosynthesis glycosyltransferase
LFATAFVGGLEEAPLLALADRIFRYPFPASPASRYRPSAGLLDRRQRALKRLFDVLVASLALLVLSPLMLVVAILVQITSPGPVIYRHRRVGQGGRGFDVLKYRTMYTSAAAAEWQITVAGDPRITPIGRWLRSSKLDELPQLWNVLRGEMSLVGWRPHVAGYPDRLTGPEAALIEERPGITGSATLYFRDEERLLSLTDDPKRHYDEVIYPLKVRMDLDYYRTWSLERDLAHLIVTALSGADSWLKVVPTPSEVPTLVDHGQQDADKEAPAAA